MYKNMSRNAIKSQIFTLPEQGSDHSYQEKHLINIAILNLRERQRNTTAWLIKYNLN
jgi:hypothetical protein